MHLNFDFSAVQILWTLTFAGLLVLLVVLLGRDRARLYPWFTASMVFTAVRLLASRMLYGRMAPITSSKIFLSLAVVASVVGFLVIVELGRSAFARASRRTVIVGILMAAVICALILANWGGWPSWKTLTADSTLATLRLMQLVTQKIDLLNQVLAVVLGLAVVLFGRRFHAGFRSHTQQIVIGLSTSAIAQMAVRGIWQLIAMHAAPQSEAEYEKIMGLQEKLYNGSSVVLVLVIVWWIVCLWINEPGSDPAANPQPATPEPAPEPQA